MDDQDDPKAEASAEKAYAAAAEAVPVASEPDPRPVEAAVIEAAVTEAATPAEPEAAAPPPVEFPAKARRAAKPAVAAEPAPPKPRKAAKPVSKVKPVKPAVVSKAKPVPVKALPKPASKSVLAKGPTKAAAIKASPVKAAGAVKSSPAPQLKEKTMEKAAEFTEGLQKVAAEAQAKAKSAYDKGTALFGEYAEFAKGNVEALVESGKILSTGAQKIGSDWVAQGKTAFETATSDVKQLTAVKSPTDFFKLHTDILRRNFDSAIALTSKNGEAFAKLATDSFAPISGRISLATEKLKKAA